jgi:acetylornithine deacetylase
MEWITSNATIDSRFLQLYGGIPAACDGPQSSNTHGIDEWVSIGNMMEVTQVLALFMARWCQLNER